MKTLFAFLTGLLGGGIIAFFGTVSIIMYDKSLRVFLDEQAERLD